MNIYFSLYISAMSFTSLISKLLHRGSNSSSKEIRHTFTDEDRERSSIKILEKQIRQQRIDFLKAKLERMKSLQEEAMLEEQVADLEDQFYDQDEEPQAASKEEGANPDAMLMQLFGQVLQGRQQQQAPTQTTLQPPQKLHLDNTQLQELLKKIPSPLLKTLKKKKDEEIIQLARSYAPEYVDRMDEDTLNRAIALIKS